MMNWNLTSKAPMITTMVRATTSFVFVPQDGEAGFCGCVIWISPALSYWRYCRELVVFIVSKMDDFTTLKSLMITHIFCACHFQGKSKISAANSTNVRELVLKIRVN